MTRAWLLLALLCCGWTLPVSWRYPSTNADGTPLTDLDHAEITLRRCTGDSLRLPNIPATGMEGDSAAADLEILDGIPHVALELRCVDHSGNRGGMLSLLVAHEAQAAPPPDTTSGGIAPHYYVGTSRGGQAIIGPVGAIDYSWGLGSPIAGIPVDQWSMDLSGFITIPTTGAYTFYLKSEDGGQLFVNGTLGINHYGVQALTEWTWTVNLTAGEKPITVTYMANNGNSECHVSWSGPGISKQPIPRGALR